MILADDKFDDLIKLLPELPEQLAATLMLSAVALALGGLFGLILGISLYATRPGNVFSNTLVYNTLNFLVNFFRPIPFIILAYDESRS